MPASAGLDHIQQHLLPLRQQLLAHPLYSRIDSLPALRTFMQHHVFAVWDFMSLLKTLQQRLCCVNVPWLPPVNGQAARLINEIVLGEESDEDGQGSYASHYDLYHRAMIACGADTGPIDRFGRLLQGGLSVDAALGEAELPASVRQFVAHTFQILATGNLAAIAAAFTFGREDLLPAVFQRIVDELNVESSGGLDQFQFYLQRHIQLDGDHHGPMAGQLVEMLCGHDPAQWQAAERAAISSLQARLVLWDGMLAAIEK
ncbi:hypothetical protein ETAA8_36540 [Anatilimnocola aggregata]|uniref:DUF3050 domain-containing protein n=1 Tax=Anatilimnocola aggregata TaxID=2528021 RepID=A0A517YEA2_9BACT|nr:DUF3050 domain-containing protein [Anatilimnocola aggregata]QDU28551.1 hypothetical protein ETAA8_36540 [Anatilimnocola aggregata]